MWNSIFFFGVKSLIPIVLVNLFRPDGFSYVYNNHATTKLAISLYEMSQISCQKHKIGSLLLLYRYKTNYIKSCSFLLAHFSGTMKIVENLSRKAFGETPNYWKDIYCRYTLELPL